MTRILGECPSCGRTVFLVNDRYPKVPTRLRMHYPKKSKQYQELPKDYCQGRQPKGTP